MSENTVVDIGGAFLELEPSSPQEEESDQSTEEGEPGDELDAAKRQIAKMEEELEDLKTEMEQEKERADELWHVTQKWRIQDYIWSQDGVSGDGEMNGKSGGV